MLLRKDGESFEFNVVCCCGFIEVGKGDYLGPLRRYDRRNTCWTCPKLFIIAKYVKIRFKNRGLPCYFLSLRGQKIKNITKIGQKRLFLFTLLVLFSRRFSRQN